MLKKGVKIAVTGGGGFLGGHLLPRAIAQGADLTCLVRSSQTILPQGVKVLQGDCLNAEDMKTLMADQDIFIHMAALLFGNGWQDYFRANIRAAENIVEAFKSLPEDRRPVKMIFTSSLSAAGPSMGNDGKSEREEATPVSAYGWSKLCCERILAAAPVSELTILRPPIIYGSGDRGLLPLFKSAAKGIGVSPGAFRKFPVSVIHAKDAAAAILLACRPDLNGVYHLSDGRRYDMDEFCRAAAKACGREKCVVFHPPLPFMALTAKISDAFFMLRARMANDMGRRPPKPPHWNTDKYEEAKQAGWLADSAKFDQAVGFQAEMTLEKGLAEAVAGYHARGWL